MARKKGLGRGLDALLSDSDSKVEEKDPGLDEASKSDEDGPNNLEEDQAKKTRPGGKEQETSRNMTSSDVEEDGENNGVEEEILKTMHKLPLDQIQANPDQPRKDFDQEKLEELAESIRKYGILQPLVVKKQTLAGKETFYEIIAGERRYRAAQLAGLEEVPVVLREENSDDSAILSVVENVQREDLNPLEEALAYESIMQGQLMTQQELADALGKSRSYVANIVRLLKLDDESMDALRQGLLTSSQARSLLAEKDLTKRSKLRKLFIEGKTSVNAVETQTRKREKPKDIFLLDLENRMSESLGTKVSITKKRKGWNVQVECYTEEDLNQLLELIEETER